MIRAGFGLESVWSRAGVWPELGPESGRFGPESGRTAGEVGALGGARGLEGGGDEGAGTRVH